MSQTSNRETNKSDADEETSSLGEHTEMDASKVNFSQDTTVTSKEVVRGTETVTDPLIRQSKCPCILMADLKQDSIRPNGGINLLGEKYSTREPPTAGQTMSFIHEIKHLFFK